MMEANVRKQGGAAILTIPADIMRLLDIKIGTKLSLDVVNGELIVKLSKSNERKKYTLAELLEGATSSNIKALNKATQWAREGKSVGREI